MLADELPIWAERPSWSRWLQNPAALGALRPPCPRAQGSNGEPPYCIGYWPCLEYNAKPAKLTSQVYCLVPVSHGFMGLPFATVRGQVHARRQGSTNASCLQLEAMSSGTVSKCMSEHVRGSVTHARIRWPAVRPSTALQMRLCRFACVAFTGVRPLHRYKWPRGCAGGRKEVPSVPRGPRAGELPVAKGGPHASCRQAGNHLTRIALLQASQDDAATACCYASTRMVCPCVSHTARLHGPAPLHRPTAARSGRRPVRLAFPSFRGRRRPLLPLPTTYRKKWSRWPSCIPIHATTIPRNWDTASGSNLRTCSLRAAAAGIVAVAPSIHHIVLCTSRLTTTLTMVPPQQGLMCHMHRVLRYPQQGILPHFLSECDCDTTYHVPSILMVQPHQDGKPTAAAATTSTAPTHTVPCPPTVFRPPNPDCAPLCS